MHYFTFQLSFIQWCLKAIAILIVDPSKYLSSNLVLIEAFISIDFMHNVLSNVCSTHPKIKANKRPLVGHKREISFEDTLFDIEYAAP